MQPIHERGRWSEEWLNCADYRYRQRSWHANLANAILIGADLKCASLSEAVGLTEEQIAAAESLEGATMPNGQKYKDWLKSCEEGDSGS